MIAAPAIDWAVLAPVGFAAIGAMTVLVAEVLLARRKALAERAVTDAFRGAFLALASMAFLLIAFYVASAAFADGAVRVFHAGHPMFRMDPFSTLASALLALVAFLTCALSVAYLSELRIQHGEFYALILLSTAGMMVLVSAVDLLTLFVGFELASVPLYVLAGFDRRHPRSNESAMKYFVLGAFASAVLLYGMALLYGAAGSTAYPAIREALSEGSALGIVGLALVVVGFAFKATVVPFHQWAPDVYEGAPSVVTAFLSVASKSAAFLGLTRLLVLGFGASSDGLSEIFGWIAIATMVVGNAMALIQDNVKRMLAYSSIAHAGYLFVGVTVGDEAAFTAVVFYLIVYAFMNLGAFGVVISLARGGRDFERIEGFAGLARRRPGLSAAMAVFMFALVGIPGTAGFMAKFNVVLAAVHGDRIGLAIVLALTSAVSVFYYLRIPMLMYMRNPEFEGVRPNSGFIEVGVLAVCVAAVLWFGIFPNEGVLRLADLQVPLHALDWANAAARSLFRS